MAENKTKPNLPFGKAVPGTKKYREALPPGTDLV